MASLNKVYLIGNVTKDVEMRYTPKGTAVTEITIAVNRARNEEHGTTFIPVTMWGKTAEIAGKYVSKGSLLMIDGRVQIDTWDDRQTGQKRSKLRVICEDMQMLASSGARRTSRAHDDDTRQDDDTPDTHDDVSNDDIPF